MAASTQPWAGSGLADAGSVDLSDLPPPDTVRWVARRKAQVVRAVREGRIDLEAACERYKLSPEEFLNWERMIERHGEPGLRVTRLQRYRD